MCVMLKGSAKPAGFAEVPFVVHNIIYRNTGTKAQRAERDSGL